MKATPPFWATRIVAVRIALAFAGLIVVPLRSLSAQTVRPGSSVAVPVPATAPDSVPGWIYADSNLIHDKHVTGYFPKNIIALLFKSRTSQALMQAAIDSVRGVVVGGLQPLNVYYVKVPSDTTGEPLFAAITKLMAMSQVELATPSVLSVGPASPSLK